MKIGIMANDTIKFKKSLLLIMMMIVLKQNQIKCPLLYVNFTFYNKRVNLAS